MLIKYDIICITAHIFIYYLMNKTTTPTTLNENTATNLAGLFRALSDPTRLRIIAALMDGEVNVSTLAEIVGISESAVSHQLSTMRHMRLVRARRQGRQVYYSLDDEHVADLFQRGLEHVTHG